MTWEPWVRLGSFVAVLLLMALGERLLPRRKPTQPKSLRWANHLALAVFNTIVVRLLLPLGAVGMALLARERGWGLLNNVELPAWAAVLFAIILLDLVIYLQHVLFHAVPLLWRLHQVHHADLDFDASTGFRFHTVEMVLSMGLKLAAINVVGASPLAVVLFEVLLNASALFNHGNVKMPAWLDRLVRLVLVTPDMHRVHHSVVPEETNSNFGFCLPWWDWIFGTYRAEPAAGHEHMAIGLAELQDVRVERLPWMLAQPWLTRAAVSGLLGKSSRSPSPTGGPS